jgi:hypothetical protein
MLSSYGRRFLQLLVLYLAVVAAAAGLEGGGFARSVDTAAPLSFNLSSKPSRLSM